MRRRPLRRSGDRSGSLPARIRDQGTSFRRYQNPSVGPSSGSVASHTIVSAPSSTVVGAPDPPIRVRTQPGSAALTSTPGPASAATIRVSAFTAAFDSPYAPAAGGSSTMCA